MHCHRRDLQETNLGDMEDFDDVSHSTWKIHCDCLYKL